MSGGKNTQQPFKGALQAVAGFHPGDFIHRHSLAHDECQIGNNRQQHGGGCAKGRADGFPPALEFGVTARQQLPDKLPERQSQPRIGGASPQLLIFAGNEKTAPRRDGHVQFGNEGGFPNPGRPGDENHFTSGLADAVEGFPQEGNFAPASIQPFGDDKGSGVMPSQRKGINGGWRVLTVAGELALTLKQVGPDAGSRLVAVVGRFGQKLGHDVGEGRRYLGSALLDGRQHERQVRMDDFQWVVRPKRQGAGQQLVEQHAESVQVGARINRATHAAGLLRREVVERALEHICCGMPGYEATAADGNAEVNELDLPGGAIDDDI